LYPPFRCDQRASPYALGDRCRHCDHFFGRQCAVTVGVGLRKTDIFARVKLDFHPKSRCRLHSRQCR
jgi:hypothetical protein